MVIAIPGKGKVKSPSFFSIESLRDFYPLFLRANGPHPVNAPDARVSHDSRLLEPLADETSRVPLTPKELVRQAAALACANSKDARSEVGSWHLHIMAPAMRSEILIRRNTQSDKRAFVETSYKLSNALNQYAQPIRALPTPRSRDHATIRSFDRAITRSRSEISHALWLPDTSLVGFESRSCRLPLHNALKVSG
jgi:hypothetical protein